MMRLRQVTVFRRRLSGAIASAAVALATTVAHAQAIPDAPRFEAPIRALQLSDETIRYGVAIAVNGAPAMAGLDTGAMGLRLMPDAPGRTQSRATTKRESFTFGTGSHLEGPVGEARLTIGGVSGQVPVHLVEHVDCEARRPVCPGLLGLGYGFLGDGLPKEGYRILLGANMDRTGIDNPLMALGARRWIIELPRPGEAGEGRLVANPTDEELAGFSLVRLMGGFHPEGGGLHDAIWGCLANPAEPRQACGPMLMDTGAFALRVNNSGRTETWPDGTPMVLDFRNSGAAPVVSMRLVVGAQAQDVALAKAPSPGIILQPGVAPYYAFSILYDPVRRVIGFKPRTPIAGLPQAVAGK
jgi:hypothetical protein